MDRRLSAAGKVLSANLHPFSQRTSWQGSPGQHVLQFVALTVLLVLPPAWQPQWQGHWGLFFLTLISLCAPHHSLTWSCCTTRLWEPTCESLVPVLTRNVTRERIRQIKGICFCSVEAQLRHVLPLQMWGDQPFLYHLFGSPQGHEAHCQFLCIHPIAKCTANKARVSAEELLYRLLSPFLLEAELCCSANQPSNWVNTT